MKWCTGDLIEISKSEKCNVIAFTANSYVTSDFRLVMGAGCAKRVRDHFLGVDFDLGNRIRKRISSSLENAVESVVSPKEGVQADYYVAGVPRDGIIVAAVQVKRHYQDHKNSDSKKACFELTIASLKKLRRWCEKNNDSRVVINCPLIGCGGYSQEEDQVKAMVEKTLGSVDIYVCTLKRE